MRELPVGYVISTVVAAVFVACGLWPRDTHGPRATPTYVLGTVSSELYPLMVLLVLGPAVLAVAEGDLHSLVGAAALVLPVLTLAGIGVSLLLALRCVAVLDTALREQLGIPTRLHWWDGWGQLLRVLLAPLPWPRRGVQRIKDLRYGDAPGDAHLLDLYVPRTRRHGSPVLVYFHGGGFFSGAKSREARLLLERLAGRGWVCVSANYRLRPARFPEQVVDAKRVLAWLRAEGPSYGADPSRILVSGGSAGAHLAMMCASTGNVARFQPGFEEVDTDVVAAVGFYGYYGPADDEGSSSSPADHLHPGLPPLMVVHGTRDPMVHVRDARQFVEAIRRTSSNPVVWAELPGGLHAFDRFASVRSAAVAAAVELFGDTVLARSGRSER